MTDKQKAIIRYHESGIEKEEQSPLERLRFFCSLAMSGDDWLDAEMFFDSLALQVRDKVDVGPWSAGATSGGRAYLESSDFTHDVRLYIDGDFAWPGDKLNYAQGIAGQLNAAPVSAEPDVTQQTLSDVHVAYSRGKADGLSERVDLIRFDYVNADGQPDSKMITHDEMRERYAVAIRHAYGQAQQPVSSDNKSPLREAVEGSPRYMDVVDSFLPVLAGYGVFNIALAEDLAIAALSKQKDILCNGLPGEVTKWGTLYREGAGFVFKGFEFAGPKIIMWDEIPEVAFNAVIKDLIEARDAARKEK